MNKITQIVHPVTKVDFGNEPILTTRPNRLHSHL